MGGEICTRGSVDIRVNDYIGHYFQTLKGLRHEDILFPIFFNIIVDMKDNLMA
jgi:hypothetical protein